MSIGYLEIDERVIIRDSKILVKGWCLVNKKEASKTGIVYINGQKMGHFDFDVLRPDVRSAFPDYEWAEQSGFSVETKTGTFRGRCRIGIKAVTETNQSHYIEKDVYLEDSPEMKENVRLELIEEIEKTLPVPAFPVQAYIEVTTACNLACIMCRNERIQGKQVPWNLFLDRELFLKLKAVFPHLLKVNLNGWGEPTLHRDYADFIKIIRDQNKDCEINFTSNFNRITEDLMNAIVDYRISNINISCDGASAEVYEKIRRKGSFRILMQNIETLARKMKEKGASFPCLTYEFVIQKDNIHELVPYIRFIHDLGGRFITLEHVCGAPHLEIDYGEHLSAFDEAIEQAKKLDICIGGSGCQHFMRHTMAKKRSKSVPIEEIIPENGPETSGLSSDEAPKKEIACFEPFQTVFVNPDGRLTPCCLSDRLMGNLNDSSFEAIWLGYEYNLFRKEMIDQNYDANCQRCIALLKNIPKIESRSALTSFRGVQGTFGLGRLKARIKRHFGL
jgi:radical SAM protein with 4Fe4S-binding SPASM domain